MEDAVDDDVRGVLQQIAAALDAHRSVRVHGPGLVALDPAFPPPTETMEINGERQRQKGSATGSRKRAAGWQGTAGRPRPAGAAPRLGGDGLRAAYEAQLSRLAEAYPSLRTFTDADGMWLLANSSVLPGLKREATFLVALPFKPGLGPRAWGFWRFGDRLRWIGPRHTNFGDGSICAFSPDDGVWSEGGELASLLDLYTVWALRHLHLEVFGRWPGRQYSLSGADPRAQAFYRLRECNEDELCGCGSTTLRYADCCKPLDQRADFRELADAFLKGMTDFSSRKAPAAVEAFLAGDGTLPGLREVLGRVAIA